MPHWSIMSGKLDGTHLTLLETDILIKFEKKKPQKIGL